MRCAVYKNSFIHEFVRSFIHCIKTSVYFHMKRFARRLVLRPRHKVTRKWPIQICQLQSFILLSCTVLFRQVLLRGQQGSQKLVLFSICFGDLGRMTIQTIFFLRRFRLRPGSNAVLLMDGTQFNQVGSCEVRRMT